MVDFASALDTKANDVEKPPVQPQGTYIWTVTKVPSISTSKSGEWSIVEFPIKAVSAEDDVDPEELEEFGSLNGAMNRISFMAPTADTPEAEADRTKALYRIKKFCQNTLRVDAEEDASIRELLDAAVNCQFMAQATWRPSDDGEETYIDVKGYAPVD
ncbi:MAG: hypothetical protein CL484_03200 [Acidobacteria bacterium]|nr:hypothetical protein [Acidobacteriota bacterium]|tara:strand:+ start:123 stop:596 length:474 start_codon:yes stop_codon:yes gene_type:complete